jgi:hypothetical protein
VDPRWICGGDGDALVSRADKAIIGFVGRLNIAGPTITEGADACLQEFPNGSSAI